MDEREMQGRVLDLLREIAREPLPIGPVELDRDYLRALAWQASLPENQSGADKSWVYRLVEATDLELRAAVELPTRE